MNPLVVVLRAIQNSANNQHSEAPLTWDAINRATQAYGAPDIDFERFSQMYDNDPTIQGMVDNFDGNGIQLKTDQGSQQPAMGQEPKTGMMAAAAKRATKLGK